MNHWFVLMYSDGVMWKMRLKAWEKWALSAKPQRHAISLTVYLDLVFLLLRLLRWLIDRITFGLMHTWWDSVAF